MAQYFGEFEYVFGCFKLTFIVMLILLMVILDTIKRMYRSSGHITEHKLIEMEQHVKVHTMIKWLDQRVRGFPFFKVAYMLIYKFKIGRPPTAFSTGDIGSTTMMEPSALSMGK
jgi:amino acid permease